MRRTLLGFALLAIAALLSGCGGDAASVTHNEADVQFARHMVPHHEQAMEMAGLVPERTDNEAVRKLASRIEQAQGPEIDQLETWLAKWGAPGAETGGHGEHSGKPGMAGMMSDAEMSALSAAEGAKFDSAWLDLMIKHHEGAVEMARTEIADGTDPETVAMAQRIVDAQLAEIAEMRELLNRP
ncbi:Uncharacterized conserved protein, DUF305 family [Amycolatopsis marina]|uniref:Uncharacterized conserved protein, DUF305 family n=1 Tax=Amycolatopsis marina TaxID=490629 RepID=A0A1I0XJU2_9PSEU|nr:DUF305 domain-containing protein [Amycolatopsis marina]SFB01379.1 Uncharacterized conserved protein, DUF305 family [Amycolatopsis marina]